jgi:heme/copper-type cytochrome/quinol oxidase subunit 4
MLVAILTVLNVPVFLFLAWLAFDSKEAAADTLWDTVVTILKIIFIPRFVRVLLDMDDEGAWGIVPILGFLFACGCVVYGEYWLLQRYVLGQ